MVLLLGGAAFIEVSRWVWPQDRPAWIPGVHLASISWAINLLLLYELVDMTISISKSVARSVTRLLQLYALVLLRDAFLKLESFPEPIEVVFEDLRSIAIMGADAAGGVLLFVSAAIFEKIQRHTSITIDPAEGEKFGDIKRSIVLILLGVLSILCVLHIVGIFQDTKPIPILDTFFTVLVFVYVLLAFTSLGFTTNPAIVFRNFGFAFSAILLRLALASPEFIRPALGVVGALTAIAMTLAYNLSTDAHVHTLNPHRQSPPTDTPQESPR